MKKGAPKGNQNATKGKEWSEAIRYALASFEDDTVKRGKALKQIALEIVKKALTGDSFAISEIGNRLDGKPQIYTEATITHKEERTYEDIRAELVKEHGETMAQFLLHEITEEQFLKAKAMSANQTQH